MTGEETKKYNDDLRNDVSRGLRRERELQRQQEEDYERQQIERQQIENEQRQRERLARLSTNQGTIRDHINYKYNRVKNNF